MPEKRGGKGVRVTCDDCYFRRELLCALRLDAPCPTFRPASIDGLVPPPQAPLVPLPYGIAADLIQAELVRQIRVDRLRALLATP